MFSKNEHGRYNRKNTRHNMERSIYTLNMNVLREIKMLHLMLFINTGCTSILLARPDRCLFTPKDLTRIFIKINTGTRITDICISDIVFLNHQTNAWDYNSDY